MLVHAYEEWGPTLPERLNGMFAFAVLDRRCRRLYLARDRLGEKPLYYLARPGFLAFASELFALAQHTAVSTSLNLSALRKFFAYGYIPAPLALLEGTSKLPGGHVLTFDSAHGKATVRAYWRFTIEPHEKLDSAQEPHLVDELEALLATPRGAA